MSVELYVSGIVHELKPKNMGISRVGKTQYRLLVTSGCLLSRQV